MMNMKAKLPFITFPFLPKMIRVFKEFDNLYFVSHLEDGFPFPQAME
jgi:hypothetical protein